MAEHVVSLVARGTVSDYKNIREEVKTLSERCPGVTRCAESFKFWPIVGELCFASRRDAEGGLAWLWEQRLLGSHPWLPCIYGYHRRFNSSLLDCSGNIPRVRAVFFKHIRSFRTCEAIGRCLREIERIEKELIQADRESKHTRGFNQQMLSRKNGLLSQLKLLKDKRDEFYEALSCLEMHVNGVNVSFENVVCCTKRPVFALGKAWTWEQLYNILLRERNRLESSLPIYSSRREIIHEIHRNQVIVLVGETGSGKSTQLIQFLADSGFGIRGSLICTQPRKVAAMSLSQRVSEEARGCYSQMNSVTCKITSVPQEEGLQTINFMTDHVLLQMLMSNNLLPHISCIIIDEAHERTLSTDLLLALLKGFLYRRSDLRLIIMSATADTKTLSEYFDCKVIHVKGRHFPVEIRYVGREETSPDNIVPKPGYPVISSYVTKALRIAADIHAKEEEGVILVFLTSQAEVEWACEHFQRPSVVTYAFHGKLSAEEQVRVFESVPSGTRKVIFATNIAETSVTIPGVKFVVDSGMAKESKYDPKTGMNMLKVGCISQSAAIQRCGRAGRTQPGICYRLYTREDFELMPTQSDPEILRVHLGIAILRLLALGFHEIENFDFVQAPNREAIDQAIKNLIQIGAVGYKESGLKLTQFGSKLVKLGVEPRMGKIVLDSFYQGLGKEGLVLAVLISNSGSVFCRVGSEADKSKSDRLKLRFCQADGDLFTLLSVYKEWEHEPYHNRKHWCWENSINAKTMRRCRESIQDLENCLKHQLKMIVPSYWKWSPSVSSQCNLILKKIILSSMVENLAMFSGYERLGYEVAATGQQAYLHPSCCLLALGQHPRWVVFGELLCFTRQYLFCVTTIEKDWVLQLQARPHDISQLDRLTMHRRVISGVGRHLLKRFCGKGYGNLHYLVNELQQIAGTKRIALEVEHDKQEIHLFSIAECIDKVYDLVQGALNMERKWIFNDCMEKALFHTAYMEQSQLALFGPGAQIKHLELNGKYLSVEVRHPNANLLNDRQLLSVFENCVGNIASFHKFSGTANHEGDSRKWGTITFLSAEAAEMAVSHLNNSELVGFPLSVSPLNVADGLGSKGPGFPSVKATITWPRRLSKGEALIKCANDDVERIALSCSGKQIGTSTVKCKRGKRPGTVFMAGLHADVTEHEILHALKFFTNRVILDAFILRNPAPRQPLKSVCEESLIKELSGFVPPDKCRVVVHNSDTKDPYARALVTFEGSVHLRAAKALTHLQGTALPECFPWQKITCQETFYSTLLIPCRIFDVLGNELQSLVNSFPQENLGASVYITRTEFAFYKVKISSNKMETVAKCRSMLERLTKGITILDDRLDPETMQLLFDHEGTQLLKSLERETGTCIVFVKRSLTIKVFGPAEKTGKAIKGVVEGLILLAENQYHDIPLRGESLPYGLMKEIVNKFGVDLTGLKILVPEGDFILDTRRHILRVRGSREIKARARNIVFEVEHCMKGVNHPSAEESKGKEHNCPICFSEIENSYQLEACGHSFCKTCLIEQCNSAMRHRDGFPLCCAFENCASLILISDLRSLLAAEQLDKLFAASLESFVGSSNRTYRFCTTPDCPSVYEVSPSGRLFVCGNCSAELCTTCHLEYHPYLSCKKYKEYKDDPDASLKEWCRGKEDVKKCPCGLTIEKVDGCNHIVCKCSKHICWVCLESFDASDICYRHLHAAHGSIN